MSSEKHQIQPTDPPVREALLFVCEKCGKSESRDLARDLKVAIKARGLKGVYRAVLSGCMDICPKRGIAVAVAGADRAARFLVSDGSAEDVLAFVTDKRQTPPGTNLS